MTIVVFDLDGTISDPAKGITASINYALQKIARPTQNPETLLKYIGPPLDEIFSNLLPSSNHDLIQQAIESYRERYILEGYQENTLYNGIPELLNKLQNLGCSLYVATSKREDIAKSVIKYFDLEKYFKAILGCGLKMQKEELLIEIVNREPLNDNLIMVGDRSYDMIAGKAVSASCVGVLWGYGSAKELSESGSDTLVNDPIELLRYIGEGLPASTSSAASTSSRGTSRTRTTSRRS